MSKRFGDYRDEELLTIGVEELNVAIRVEAIERGIKPPVTLSEGLRRSEWLGYERPAEAIRVFRIRCGYHEPEFGWLDQAKAEAALEGLVRVEKSGYGASATMKVGTAAASVEVVLVGVSQEERKEAKFEGYFEDTEEFDKVKEECLERVSKVRQDDYNRRVMLEKRAEYLRLAGGDEAIAAAFWEKTHGGAAWPAAPVVAEGGAS